MTTAASKNIKPDFTNLPGELPFQANSFLSYLQVERGFSLNTIASYRQDLSKFIFYLDKNKKTDLAKIDRGDLMGFLLAVMEDGLGPRSRARLISAMSIILCGKCRSWCDGANAIQALESASRATINPAVAYPTGFNTT